MLQRLRRFAAAAALAAAAASCWAGLSRAALAQQPLVDKFVFDGTVQPVSAGEMKRAINRAASDNAISRPFFISQSIDDMNIT